MNAGISVSARDFLDQLESYAARHRRMGLRSRGRRRERDLFFRRKRTTNRLRLNRFPSIMRVMERSDRIVVVRRTMHWSDLGSWDEVCGAQRTMTSRQCPQRQCGCDRTNDSLIASYAT